MCHKLAELRMGLGKYAAGFDPQLISASDAEVVVEQASAMEKMAATLKMLAAARVAETSLWRKRGDRSPAHSLARRTGTTVAQAAQALETARRLRALPEVSAAAKRGDLSLEQAGAISEAADADPESEAELVRRARESSLRELKEECSRTKAAATPDSERRRRAVHARRCLRTYTDGEGVFNLHFRDNPEVGAEIMAALDPIRDSLFREAKAKGRGEPLEAYAADALVELARSRSGEGASQGKKKASTSTKILVRVDFEALLRGYPTRGEVAEIAGYGPVAISAITDMIATGSAFLAAVVTRGAVVTGVAHLGRRPHVDQESALQWLYPSCAAEGCSAVARLEMDHRADWSKTHITVLDLLDRLCHHHHGLKTRDGWALVVGKGKRAFVSPDDPRHPRRAHAPPGGRLAVLTRRNPVDG